MYTNFLTKIPIILFHCCKSVFIHMTTWTVGKNSIRLHCVIKKTFYIHLHMLDITDGNYTRTKGTCEDFKIKHLGEYHDLNVQKGY